MTRKEKMQTYLWENIKNKKMGDIRKKYNASKGER